MSSEPNLRTISFYLDEPFVQEAAESILKSFKILKGVCDRNHLVTSPELKLANFGAAMKLWTYSLNVAWEAVENMGPEEKFLIQDLQINAGLGNERANSNIRRLWDLLFEAEKVPANGFVIQYIVRVGSPMNETFRLYFKD